MHIQFIGVSPEDEQGQWFKKHFKPSGKVWSCFLVDETKEYHRRALKGNNCHFGVESWPIQMRVDALSDAVTVHEALIRCRRQGTNVCQRLTKPANSSRKFLTDGTIRMWHTAEAEHLAAPQALPSSLQVWHAQALQEGDLHLWLDEARDIPEIGQLRVHQASFPPRP